MIAYHFVGDRLRDGRPIPADGIKLTHPGKPVMCESGLHASLDPFDALQYAPGATLCRVECGGIVVHGDDKLVCTERTILQRVDLTDALRYFARMQAVSVVHLWDAPQITLDYLMTGDDSMRDAAWGAARDAARDAAWGAALGAARDAAWGAAWSAAWGAAWDAARSAAWGAARDAARGAAWGAARDAAWDAARTDFNLLVGEAFE